MTKVIESWEKGKNVVEYGFDKHNGYYVQTSEMIDEWRAIPHYYNTYATEQNAKRAYKRQIKMLGA